MDEKEVKSERRSGKTKGYDEDGVIMSLRAKGVGFQTSSGSGADKVFKTVYIEPGMMGIKLLGMVDYLVNSCKWHLVIRKKGIYTG